MRQNLFFQKNATPDDLRIAWILNIFTVSGAWELASRRNNIYTVTDMTELLSERITMDANICHGKPTIRGLRYPVENILEWLSSGMSVDEILADYEDLEREDIMAALEFASRLAKVKRIEMLAA